MIFTQEAPLTRKWFSGRSCIRSNWNKQESILGREETGVPGGNPRSQVSLEVEID